MSANAAMAEAMDYSIMSCNALLISVMMDSFFDVHSGVYFTTSTVSTYEKK